MEDDLGNKSDEDFPATGECVAQEIKQAVKTNPEEVILDSSMNISIFNEACLAKNTQK